MNAASYFGQNYKEATRKPGQAPHPGMKTLSDQAEEPGQKIRYRCPSCEKMISMRQMLADEGEAGQRRVAVTCSACGEEIEIEAPRGRRWASEADVFLGRYRRATAASATRHAHLAEAMRVR